MVSIRSPYQFFLILYHTLKFFLTKFRKFPFADVNSICTVQFMVVYLNCFQSVKYVMKALIESSWSICTCNACVQYLKFEGTIPVSTIKLAPTSTYYTTYTCSKSSIIFTKLGQLLWKCVTRLTLLHLAYLSCTCIQSFNIDKVLDLFYHCHKHHKLVSVLTECSGLRFKLRGGQRKILTKKKFFFTVKLPYIRQF